MKMNAVRLHLITLLIALTDFWAFLIFGISFRGQLADILISIAPFLFAVLALFSGWRKLSKSWRGYLISFVILNLFATPAYMFGTICFQLPTLDLLGRYEARSRPGVMWPESAVVLKRYGPFEQQITGLIGDSHDVKLVRKDDSLFLLIPKYDQGDSAAFITRY